MTRFFVFFALFSIFVTGTLADISCYGGSTTQYGNGAPIGTLTSGYCAGSYYCMKVAYYSSSYNQFAYGCGDYRCQGTGCSNLGNGYKLCCCKGNLCNSSTDFSKTALIVFALLSVFYVYH